MKVKLNHWSSKPDLKVLDPTFHGTGIRGAESKRREQWPQYYVDRIYFGTGKYKPEVGLGQYKYTIEVNSDDLYNMAKDPKEFAAKSVDQQKVFNVTKMEKLIKRAGYLGAFNPEHPVVAIFKPIRVLPPKK